MAEAKVPQQGIQGKKPRELGFYFPGEFEKQEAVWLSWPHNVNSWPDKNKKGGTKELKKMLPDYCLFVSLVSKTQQVHINVNNEEMKAKAWNMLFDAGASLSRITFHVHPTNDAWCRDHGPAFVVNREIGEKAIVDWEYNAWGGKYPCELDNQIPSLIAQKLGLCVFKPGIVMEGGAVDFNGQGTVLTTRACLLNKNRNPNLTWIDIQSYLEDYYGVTNVLWLEDGIVGDDTDGHVDDIARFVNPTTVVTMVEHDKRNANYKPLAHNLELLADMKLETGQGLQVVELPMPKSVTYQNQQLPASYANFLITNKNVIVPTFRDTKNDDIALQTLKDLFPEREVVPIDSINIIWGLGSFHCLSQQEPAV